MRCAHNIEMRVFCKEDELEEPIHRAINKLMPADPSGEDILIKIDEATSFDEKKLKIITVFTKKEKYTTQFLKNVFENISSEDKKMIEKQLESRLDDRLHLYIRLDKEKLLKGEYKVTDSGNCFRIDICIAAYPHKKDAAIRIVKKLLEY